MVIWSAGCSAHFVRLCFRSLLPGYLARSQARSAATPSISPAAPRITTRVSQDRPSPPANVTPLGAAGALPPPLPPLVTQLTKVMASVRDASLMLTGLAGHLSPALWL